MKALFTYDYGKERMDSLEKLGYEIIVINEKNLNMDTIPRDIEILGCYNPFKNINVEDLPSLKWIQLSSTGYDQIPLKEVMRRNIRVTNNKGGYSKPIGEWIVMSTLNIYKDAKYFFKKQEEKKWKINSGIREIVGKNILFLGTGTVAIEGAKRFQGFETNITGINSTGRKVEYFDRCVPISNLMEELEKSDIVICTLPYDKNTHHLIDINFLGKMKDSSVLINVSRGKVLDEESLKYYLDRGKFLGVSMDVFENEPLAESNELWNYEKIYISPHNSWISEMRNERRFEAIYMNMKNYRVGGNLINEIVLSKE